MYQEEWGMLRDGREGDQRVGGQKEGSSYQVDPSGGFFVLSAEAFFQS
jgi:hypothetical protein